MHFEASCHEHSRTSRRICSSFASRHGTAGDNNGQRFDEDDARIPVGDSSGLPPFLTHNTTIYLSPLLFIGRYQRLAQIRIDAKSSYI